MRLLATLALASCLLAAPTKVTSVEGITEYRLDNGLQVLLFPDNSKPTVTVNLTYMVGSRHEGAGETGMAHLLEHMMFKGTKVHGEILAELSKHGATGYNASTDYDRTNYYETLNAAGDNLRWALAMEADRMVNSRIAQSDLDSEMTVVRNEFEKDENSAANVLEERVLSTAYLWHAYGRSVIGARSDIERVPIEKLQAFYRVYYQPDNAMLVVAGQFDPEKTLGWIDETLGAVPKPTRKLAPTYTVEPTQDGEREVVLRRTGDQQLVMAAFHMPASAHPDVAPIEVLISILGDRTSGRLEKALVESKKAVSAGADENLLHDPGYMLFTARTRKDGDLADAEKTMLGVIDEVVKEPPSKDEVDRARTRLLTGIERQMNNSAGVGLSLSEWGSMGDWRLLFLNRDRIEKVTPEEVARVAKQYLKTSNRTIGRFIPEAAPERAEIPAAPDLVATLKDYKGKAAVEDGEAFDPSPANIEARAQRITLPSGMKLVLLPKKTRGGTVTAALELHWGNEQNLFGRATAASVAGSLLGRATRKHTRQQLQEEMTRLKATVRVGGSATGGNASVSGVKATFPDALRLAAEMLREPAFPESDFAQLRQSSLAAAEGRRSDPQSIVNNQRSRHTAPYPAGDIRAVMTPEESIAAINQVTLDDARKFYADFYGAGHAEMVVIGDFDPAEVQELAVELFGDWKSPAPYQPVTRSWQKLATVNRSTVAPDKTNAVFTLVSTMSMDQDDPDYLPMTLANFITGGNATSRLWVRVREQEGLSYSVQTAFNAGADEKFAQFTGIAICAPQNMPKVETAFREELAKIVRDGFTPAEVEAAKKTLLEDYQAGRASDTRLVSSLATQAHYGWTMQRTEDREKKLAALTVAEVNAAAKKWLDPAAFSIFKAGDFK